MTLIAELDTTEDLAVVTRLHDYGTDDVPNHMTEPAFVDVTDVDPRPEEGYTYDGTTFAPGPSQHREATRQAGRDALRDALPVNDAYLGISQPSSAQTSAQVAELTRQMNLVIQGVLQEFE
jgi:hypothetical protein